MDQSITKLFKERPKYGEMFYHTMVADTFVPSFGET